MGKFANRLQLPKIRFPSEQEDFHKLLEDSIIQVKGIELLNNEDRPESDIILINYIEKEEFIKDCQFGNVVLATLSTAHAGLPLYQTLEH